MTTITDYSIHLRVDKAILDYVMYIATHDLLENMKLSFPNGQQPKTKAILNKSLETVDCELGFILFTSL
jgi:hypothetical protein